MKQEESQKYNQRIWELWLRKGTLTYRELTHLINRELGTDFNAEAVRKRIEYMRAKPERQGHGEDGDSIFRELERKKQVFRDERTAWQKQNRDQARTEANLDALEAQLKTLSGKLFRNVEIPIIRPGKKSMLILLTDWHIGISYDNQFGHYSPEIAAERAKSYLLRIHELQKAHQCEHAYVMALGDMISGHIHPTVRLENREGLIEQTKSAVEIITNFLMALLRMFPAVTYTGCAGNHSRVIAQKDQNLRDDRLDLLIDWMVSKLLQDQERFDYIEPLDATMTALQIYGREIIGVHGDYDSYGKPAIQNITSALHRYPWMICTGHMHTAQYCDTDGVKVIMGGSLSGTGDDYTVQKRLSGRPSQTAALLSERGLESLHPVEL